MPERFVCECRSNRAGARITPRWSPAGTGWGSVGTASRRRLSAGYTHIPFASEMPHGGFKHSGYGKDLSMYGFEDYTRVKHVMSYFGG